MSNNHFRREGDHISIYDWDGKDADLIYHQAYSAARELIAAAALSPGDLLVVGCSTSEVCGAAIGSESLPEVAQQLCRGILAACRGSGIYLAAQCCEHLNRALILEKEAALPRGYAPVCVVPVPKAGGSFAAAAYAQMTAPVAVESIRADAGLDIGDTFIGMHLKAVAVPIRLQMDAIGQAHLTAARTRPKYIGGSRAVYE